MTVGLEVSKLCTTLMQLTNSNATVTSSLTKQPNNRLQILLRLEYPNILCYIHTFHQLFLQQDFQFSFITNSSDEENEV